jgi:hypothetical protein
MGYKDARSRYNRVVTAAMSMTSYLEQETQERRSNKSSEAEIEVGVRKMARKRKKTCFIDTYINGGYVIIKNQFV